MTGLDFLGQLSTKEDICEGVRWGGGMVNMFHKMLRKTSFLIVVVRKDPESFLALVCL